MLKYCRIRRREVRVFVHLKLPFCKPELHPRYSILDYVT